MRALPLLMIASLGLSACDAPEPAKPRKPIVVRSAAQDQLHQLDDLNRAIGLKRAIQASEIRCKRVTESGYVQEHKNLSMWTASCDDGTAYAIFVAPDGTAQVRPCADLAQFGLPACVIAKKTEPAKPAAG
ncbi:MAG: hypothetical protein ABIP91_05955 [Sphingomicrobium sp.]